MAPAVVEAVGLTKHFPVRDGLLALTTGGVDAAAVAVAMKEATAAPSRALRLADLDVEGALAAALAPRPREAWIVRPDGHLAAVVPDPAPPSVAAATRRAVGYGASGGSSPNCW